MECPFCTEDLNDEAIACKGCGRDLRLVRPLVEENIRLVARIENLQAQVDMARAAVERTTAPLAFWSVHSSLYVAAPAALLIAAHFVIVVVLDVSPLYLRFASILMPLPFGFAMLWFTHHGIAWSILDGILIGLISVAGMLIVVAFMDNISVLPQNAREWRET